MSKQTCLLPLLSGRAVPFLGRHERRVKLGAIRRRLQHHIIRVSRQREATDDCAMEPQYHVQIVVHVQIWLTCLGHVQWVRSRVITEERHTPGLPRSAACPHAGRMQLTQNDSASSSLADMRSPCLAVAAGSSGATCSAWCRQHVTGRPFVHLTNCRSAGAIALFVLFTPTSCQNAWGTTDKAMPSNWYQISAVTVSLQQSRADMLWSTPCERI